MTDNDDLLDGTVDEVKDKIDEATDLDYSSLLSSEEEGKDRKTVKEYIESKMSNDEEDDSEEAEDVSEEEVLEEIEKETAGGILGGYSKNSIFAGGLILGLLVGLVAMGVSGMAGGQDKVSPQTAQDRVTQIVGEQVQLSSFETEHGLYTFNITSSGQQGNETVTRTQSFYMTLDGDKIIPKQSPLTGSSMVIDVEDAISAAEQQRNQPTTNQTTGNTTQ
ncbi:hypothetical protein [Candidatus Nanohalovita haloferacivicina]|uniref:hypothetical protein n=1 Tax=Candidatus Nanohalovita haloferacivicina TaxID=2978046 RepID=UPI00325FCF8A